MNKQGIGILLTLAIWAFGDGLNHYISHLIFPELRISTKPHNNYTHNLTFYAYKVHVLNQKMGLVIGRSYEVIKIDGYCALTVAFYINVILIKMPFLFIGRYTHFRIKQSNMNCVILIYGSKSKCKPRCNIVHICLTRAILIKFTE